MSKKTPYPSNGSYPPYNFNSNVQITTGGATPPSPQPLSAPTQLPEAEAQFSQVYEAAKLNRDWDKVRTGLIEHPDWLTKIPNGRSWTMLHQIVFSGDVKHLDDALTIQIDNPQFRLLYKAKDGKTVRDVANEREHIHAGMRRRIERLITSDELLNNAKERKWDLVKQCILAQPDIVNEKPPYRRYYLAHHLAYVGQLDKFKELSQICHFQLDLVADGQTILEVARKNNKIAFAEHIESIQGSSSQASGSAAGHAASSSASGSTAGHGASSKSSGSNVYYSTSYENDLCMSFIPPTVNLNNLFPSSSHAQNHHNPHTTHQNYNAANNQYFATHSLYHGGYLTTANSEPTSNHNEQNDHKKSVKSKPSTSKASNQEENAYEETVKSNIAKMPQDNLLDSITCSITKCILRDPVVAADGFTYEREAITKWFETSNRSPMTNEELDNRELKPNYAIKSILQALQGTNSLPKKSDKK